MSDIARLRNLWLTSVYVCKECHFPRSQLRTEYGDMRGTNASPLDRDVVDGTGISGSGSREGQSGLSAWLRRRLLEGGLL